MTGAAQATPISISDWGGFSGASSVNISGDGKTIAYIYNGSLHTIPFQGGQDPKIIAPTHSSCASLVWGNDHTTLYFTATDPDKETSRLKGLQLWSVSTKRNAAPKLLTRHYVSIQKFKLAPRDQKILLIEQVKIGFSVLFV